eukprot:TRINITY_DN9258_c0_g1_i1.p1 TRINITY_DN9258_c0_g1~~TRINITY_DN9258_c0_g1_i1.p1  ORF type:complete len:248 (-),score=27.65 TRINITY_DN9258_c0_g1_i1:36-779(-)
MCMTLVNTAHVWCSYQSRTISIWDSKNFQILQTLSSEEVITSIEEVGDAKVCTASPNGVLTWWTHSQVPVENSRILKLNDLPRSNGPNSSRGIKIKSESRRNRADEVPVRSRSDSFEAEFKQVITSKDTRKRSRSNNPRSQLKRMSTAGKLPKSMKLQTKKDDKMQRNDSVSKIDKPHLKGKEKRTSKKLVCTLEYLTTKNNELALKVGDIVEVLSESGSWLQGQIGTTVGWFPKSVCKEVTSEPEQ